MVLIKNVLRVNKSKSRLAVSLGYLEASEQRIVVGGHCCSLVDGQRFEFAAVEHVVDAEVEAVGVEGDDRSEAYLGIYAAEAGVLEGADGVAVRDVVEVAAHNHVGSGRA